jgi:putative transposase
VFDTLLEAKVLVARWRRHYNAERPHSALGNVSPNDFVRASTAAATAVEGKTELAVLT